MTADVVYTGGDIVTVNDALPSAEAVAVKDGKIVAVGDRESVQGVAGPGTRTVDLDGRTLLPGFVDPHSHYIYALTVANQVNVSAPPAGPAADVSGIVAELAKFRDQKHVPARELIMGYGYDDTLMPDGRTLHKEDLDAVFPDNPVLVGHVSMHGAVLNSAAMRKYGIAPDTPTPPGGVIVRKDGSNEPDGLVMETAYLPIFSALPKPTPAQEVDWEQGGSVVLCGARDHHCARRADTRRRHRAHAARGARRAAEQR